MRRLARVGNELGNSVEGMVRGSSWAGSRSAPSRIGGGGVSLLGLKGKR